MSVKESNLSALWAEQSTTLPTAIAVGDTDPIVVHQYDVILSGAGTTAVNQRYTYRGEVTTPTVPEYRVAGDDDPDNAITYNAFTDTWTVRSGGFSRYDKVGFDLFDGTPFTLAASGTNPVPTLSGERVRKLATRESLARLFVTTLDSTDDDTHAFSSAIVNSIITTVNTNIDNRIEKDLTTYDNDPSPAGGALFAYWNGTALVHISFEDLAALINV